VVAPVRVEVYASEENIEIFVEADSETLAEERRRYAIINIPRHLFSEATGEAADAQQRRIANVLAFRRQMVRFRLAMATRLTWMLSKARSEMVVGERHRFARRLNRYAERAMQISGV
jgi:hypothetical protein